VAPKPVSKQKMSNDRRNLLYDKPSFRCDGRLFHSPSPAAAIFSKLFTHVASPVFSAPRNWSTKGSIRTGPI